MRKLSVSLLIAGLLLASAFTLARSVQGQDGNSSAGAAGVPHEIEEVNTREVRAPEGAREPTISFVEVTTPFCYQPNPTEDTCYINWASMNVAAVPTGMAAMTVTIQGLGIVARYEAFFQDAMTVTHEMHGSGFQVACGGPGAGGRSQLGHRYDWTIEGEDINGTTSSSSDALYCPPFSP
jgi:hypothetical protein